MMTDLDIPPVMSERELGAAMALLAGASSLDRLAWLTDEVACYQMTDRQAELLRACITVRHYRLRAGAA